MISVDTVVGSSATTNASTELIAAPAAGRSIVITSLSVTNATGSADYVEIYFGATLAFKRVAVGAAATLEIPCGRGVLVPAATAVNFKAVTGGSTIYANATYLVRNGAYT